MIKIRIRALRMIGAGAGTVLRNIAWRIICLGLALVTREVVAIPRPFPDRFCY